jgi:hypothetical protein
MGLFFQDYLSHAARRELYSVGHERLFAYMSKSGAADEGQVQVAAAHNHAFVTDQFAALEIVRRFPRSELVGEQDLYIFRKPGDARPIVTPRLGAIGDAGSWSGNCRLRGQRRFRVLATLPSAAFRALDWTLGVTAAGTLLLRARNLLNRQRMFGPSHYFVLEIGVPRHVGDVSVTLSAVAMGSGEASPEVEWILPHFYEPPRA